MTARVFRFGLLTVLMTLLAALGATAQDPPPSPSSEGANEGIAVHGHWTVTVVREGEVVERREFENVLLSGGRAHLASVLSGAATPGPWTIVVSTLGTAACADNELGVALGCTISESEGELTVTAAGPGLEMVLLEGSETIQVAGNLEGVGTHQWFCGSDSSPDVCVVPTASERVQFTGTNIESLPVLEGDQIDVTVELSFN